ncbi:MAG TPA: hypothetical protein VHB21_06660 [Minicystis sp.]|nr:hypothetical protein [Minicystis sp.]
MSDHIDERVRDWYGRRWGCDDARIAGRRVGEVPSDASLPWSIYEYEGCGHTARIFTACEFADRCSEWAESLEPRAENDLDCKRDALKMRVLDPTTVSVDGCGHRATYISLPGGGWVMNDVAKRKPKNDGANAPSTSVE